MHANVTELDISGCLPYPGLYHGDELSSFSNLEVFTYNYCYDYSLRRHPKMKEINLIEHPAIPFQNKIKCKMIFKILSRRFLKVSKSIKNLKCSRKMKMVKKHRSSKSIIYAIITPPNKGPGLIWPLGLFFKIYMGESYSSDKRFPHFYYPTQ